MVAPEVLAEARELGPNSYPTRAFCGQYLNGCFEQVVARAPANVTIRTHRSRAVAMADTHGVPDGPQGVRLENGTRLNHLDAIVLAQGHVPVAPGAREARTASLARIHHLTYVLPGNPADTDLGWLAPGEPVLLRGLGLNFFDHVALLTAGRGGRFVREHGRLAYQPSGHEPALFASSRRGVPHHARGENEKGAFGRHEPRLFTAAYVARLRAERGGRLRFRTDLWPAIASEVESVYYSTLLAWQGRLHGDFGTTYLNVHTGPERDRLLDRHGVAPHLRWDWDRIADPCRYHRFTGRDAFRDWLRGYLRDDVAAARAGNLRGPVTAALDVLRDLRNEVRLAVEHGGLDGDSHRDELDGWYTPLNAFLSIGPPASRVEEMIALIEAGVLEVTGPGTVIRVDVEEPAFVAASSVVPGPPVSSKVLIEARLHLPDLRRTTDPLLRHLIDTDQVTTYSIGCSGGGSHDTGGLAVSTRPHHVINARGQAHPRRFACGIPTESVHWVTAAGIRPGVDSVTLADTDAIARTVLALPSAAYRPAADGASGGADLLGVIV